MRYVALFLGLLIGSSCLAAKPAKVPGAPDFARKIARATSWDSLFKSVDGSLNPLVMKELRALTNDLPYPQTRVKNDRLMISNENGEHLTLVLFDRDGDVSFNGKRWTLQPLASTEAEVQRIADMIGAGQASVWDLLVPPARASGLGMTKGVAAAAYTSAAAWKAQACAKPNPSDELVKQCSLMAVSMETGADPAMEKFYPVGLKCPAENGGVLEVVSRNLAGRATRVQVTYRETTPLKVNLAVASSENKGQFEQVLNTDPNSNLDARLQRLTDKAKTQGEALLTRVCMGTKEERARYFKMLSSNAQIILASASNYENPSKSERRSSSGL